MRFLVLAISLTMLAGCGVDTASTAATGASIKKQELEDAQRAQSRAQQRIEQMQETMQQRAHQAAGSEK